MRVLWTLWLISGLSLGQAVAQQSTTAPARQDATKTAETATPAAATPSTDLNSITIPGGTKLPLSLKQAISTRNAREGDAVYAETAFPFVINDRILIPAGTYIQGKISHTERSTRGKRAEILIHFTSMI